jgi:hypothetical protein
MKKLTIDRSKWRTGNNSELATGKGDTSLLNDEGYLDIIGFELRRRGIEDKELLNRASMLALPGALACTINDAPAGWLGVVMHMNDNKMLRHEKEENLRALFIQIDVELEFIGLYVNYNS